MSKPRTLPAEETTARTAIPPALRILPITYRVDDAALALGVSESTVWGLIRKGELQAKRLGRATVIRRRDLHTFVNGLPTVEPAA